MDVEAEEVPQQTPPTFLFPLPYTAGSTSPSSVSPRSRLAQHDPPLIVAARTLLCALEELGRTVFGDGRPTSDPFVTTPCKNLAPNRRRAVSFPRARRPQSISSPTENTFPHIILDHPIFPIYMQPPPPPPSPLTDSTPSWQATEVDKPVFSAAELMTLDSTLTTVSGPSKRKRDFGLADLPGPRPKSQRLSVQLSTQLSKSLTVDDTQRESEMDISDLLDNRSMPLDGAPLFDDAFDTSSNSSDVGLKSLSTAIATVEEEWMAKKNELEYNLSLLQNGIASDSYDDLKVITEKIVESARFVAGDDLDRLAGILHDWPTAEAALDKSMKFIGVIEDMKSLQSIRWEVEQGTAALVEKMRNFYLERSDTYRDILEDGGSRWTEQGFPVEQVVLDSTASWLCSQAWILILSLLNDMRVGNDVPSQPTEQ
ncbi:hypothetical protein DFJ73DRAFT_490609 [Zopfochytrium polystomum]|nr:hypothetical protein DFJ73DRAFT_490609 [Zopfochytrium polystomum]